jgi:hypothetical protein
MRPPLSSVVAARDDTLSDGARARVIPRFRGALIQINGPSRRAGKRGDGGIGPAAMVEGSAMSGNQPEAARDGTLRRLLGGLVTAIGDWRERRALRRELADLEASGGLDATLEDLRLARWQLPQVVAGYPAAPRSLSRMLARLEIDRGAMSDTAWHDMMWSCTTCSARQQCNAWLASGRHDGYASFCPNAAVLGDLTRQDSPKAAVVSR